MKLKVLFFGLSYCVISNQAMAYDYPDAARDRSTILRAAELTQVRMENLRFPLSKQLITAPVTAIAKIPEFFRYIMGSQEGFATLHTIVFEQGSNTLTCGALVTIKPDNTRYVSVSNCGANHVQYFSNDGELIPTTKVD